jgi:peptidoglycan/LPS O-acetylase OafA/YrhL
MQSLERDPNTLAFYIKRVLRLYPLSIAVVIGYTLFRFLNTGSTGFSGSEIASNLLFIQNVTGSRNVAAVMWTQPIEFQLYVFLPILFSRFKTLISVIAAWAVAGVVALAFDYVTLAHFAPCFIAGAIAYKIPHKKVLPAYLWPMFLLAITPVCAILPMPIADTLASFAIAFAITRFKDMAFTQPFHLLAKYSYSIYLTHIFCISFALTKVPGIAKLPVAIVLLIAAPLLCFHWIEEPFIRLAKRLVESSNRELPCREEFQSAQSRHRYSIQSP